MPNRLRLRAMTLLLLSVPLALSVASQAVAASNWVASWAASPTPAAGASGRIVYQNETLREIVRLSVGGDQVRVRFTNRYGASPLIIGAATVALRAQGSIIAPNTLETLTFAGQPTATIPPGTDILSDPAPFAAAPQSEAAISLFVPDASPAATIHSQQRSAIYTALENQTAAASFPASDSSSDSRPDVWLDGVDVAASSYAPVTVAFGDSITDGYQITRDAAHEWPTVLSQRLQQARQPGAVVNAGIGGNRILHDGHADFVGFGVNALARFDSDVLAQSSVHSIIVLLGINDIGQAGESSPVSDAVSAQDVEWGLTQIAERAHAHGLKIYVGTLTPFAVTTIKNYYSPEKEQKREAVNAWIRRQSRYDGVIDFDKTLRDPAHPTQMLPGYDSGDHLHPSDAGARAMANAIPLGLLR